MGADGTVRKEYDSYRYEYVQYVTVTTVGRARGMQAMDVRGVDALAE